MALRRLVDFGTIDVRRTVAAPVASAARRTGWACRVFKLCRPSEVPRGAEIWSPAERSALADLMRRAV